MMRKKQILIQTKESPTSKQNEKVTVQYIQPQRPLSVASNSNAINHIMTSSNQPPEDLEVENVEYLEEHTNTEDYVEEHTAPTGVKDEDNEDLFYPNAIYCMLDLYKDKYENVIRPKAHANEKQDHSQVWHDIAKEMQESYFEFEAEQIRRKYFALRQQYFDVHNSSDYENFEYFEQLHEIYKDPGRENIANGGVERQFVSHIAYKDEELVRTLVCNTSAKDHADSFKSDEIVHKEHEFIDMVEKELQAMEEVDQMQEQKPSLETKQTIKEEVLTPESVTISEECVIVTECASVLKRKVNDESRDEPIKQKPKLDKCESKSNIPKTHATPTCTDPLDINSPIVNNKSPSEFTLFDYNEHQERRHREQVELLQRQQQQQRDQIDMLAKNLRHQEKALQQQNLLLQELIKRLPPL